MDAIKASVLEKLIRELCPEGVEYRELSELFKTKNGYTPSKGNKEFWENGNIPWFRMDDIRQNGGILSRALQNVTEKAVKGEVFPENSLIVATSATIGEHALITVPSLANQRFTYLLLKEEYKNKFEMRFLYYYCFKLDEYCKSNLNQGNFASVDMGKFSKFKFPLPPLPIQQEIVRILDTFTNLTAELTNKLNAELTARRKQYEYYRDELLTFGEDVPRMTLRDISVSVSSGKNKEKEQEGMYPVYGSTGVIGRTNTAKYSKEQILVARVGANAGFVHKANGTYDVSDNTIIVELKDNYNLQYVYYILQKMNLRKYAKGGGQPLVTAGELKKIEIPIPDINEQDRVVSILDKFTGISTSFDSGLPAEIAARQKQYEYYRERLLSFKESHR